MNKRFLSLFNLVLALVAVGSVVVTTSSAYACPYTVCGSACPAGCSVYASEGYDYICGGPKVFCQSSSGPNNGCPYTQCGTSCPTGCSVYAREGYSIECGGPKVFCQAN